MTLVYETERVQGTKQSAQRGQAERQLAVDAARQGGHVETIGEISTIRAACKKTRREADRRAREADRRAMSSVSRTVLETTAPR